MRTVGEILSEVRKKKEITISTVAATTKIRSKFIKAIEANDFAKLPSATTAYGFIRNYAQFLKISPSFVLAVFRRDFDQDQKGRIIPRGLVKPLDTPQFFPFFRSGLLLITIIFIGGLLFYLFSQYFSLAHGPFLEITAPAEGIKTVNSSIEIVGRTEPDATVRINGQLVNLSLNGEFRSLVNLKAGRNTIIIQASNKLKRNRRLIREVIKE